MKLIVGLGNPGVKYQLSRHNMGFLVLDQFASRYDISLNQRGFDSCFGKGRVDDHTVFLAKPQTYMNLSGIAVSKLLNYFKLEQQDLIVIHDDLDLPFECVRIKSRGGHAGHKGLLSIIQILGDQNFVRLRLGIGKPAIKTMTEDYVLQSFSKSEMEKLSHINNIGSDALTKIITMGAQSAMNDFNEKSHPPTD